MSEPAERMVFWNSTAVDGQTRELLLRFLRIKYARVYQTRPNLPESCLQYFACQAGQQIIGLLCLQEPTAYPFRINLDISRSDYVYMSRWAADQQIGAALLLNALRWAIAAEKYYLLACSKPKIINYLQTRLHLPIQILPAKLYKAAVIQADRNFYLSRPQPLLYIGDCRQWYDILSS